MLGLQRIMAADLKAFIAGAHKLSRNPLGIIALFQVLIYGIAGLITANVASDQAEILRILVWFLVLFPVLVLLAFTYLVAFHHQKLYAPSDFTDEGNFMRSFEHGLARSKRFAELEEITNRIRQEVDSLPLFTFAKLPIPAQNLLQRVYLSKDGLDFDAYLEENEDRKPECQEALRILTEETNWVEMHDGKCLLSRKGRDEVPSFIELTISRWI